MQGLRDNASNGAAVPAADPLPLRILIARNGLRAPVEPPAAAPAAVPQAPVAHAQASIDHRQRHGHWATILARLGVGRAVAARYFARSHENGTPAMAEILAGGLVHEADLCREFARTFDLEFIAALDPDRLIMREERRRAFLETEGGWQRALIERADGTTRLLFAPRDPDFAELAAYLARYPGIRDRICIVAPSALRRAVIAQSRNQLIRDACNRLLDRHPHSSARHVISSWQAAAIGVLVVALPVLMTLNAHALFLALHLFMSVFFLACVTLRVFALKEAAPPRPCKVGPVVPARMPRYDVLVALYREANMVPQLLVAMGKLQWPRSKLSIKLVCEADDRETLDALRAHDLDHRVEIVEVPPGGPRTKPKALAYALQLCTGEFVALYDAEDRPHPEQLIEAWQEFGRGGDRLACVQAPLFVANGHEGIIPRMFAFEYSGLFRGMLPWLAGSRLMFPLGGTSNHFRRAALVEVGGWDPYNVTEDADLGLRLHRFRHRTATISLPTLEDGPEDFGTWLPQRVRWFKGWLQTWLVHMRDPARLAIDLGPRSFAVSQIMFLGLILSALIHPVFLATMVVVGGRMMLNGPAGSYESVLFVIDFLNISMGYAAFIALSAFTLARAEKRSLWKIVLFTPAYWLMLSVAAWLALREIIRQPHHWNKTPHRAARRYRRPAPDDPASAQYRGGAGSGRFGAEDLRR